MPPHQRASTGAPPPTDEELVRRANAGDRGAFAALYERHRGFVHALAWRLTGDADLAADVVQETFLWWLGRFPGFELRAKVTTFLHPVTRSIALDRLRRRGRQPRALDADDEMAPEPAREPSATSFDGDMTAAIGSLPAGAQEMLILRHVHGLALAEIAEALGVPLGTVKSRLHAATEALRRQVDGR